MTLHFRPDPERDGELVPAYGDCDCCRGRGVITAADETRACPNCLLKLRREYGPFVDALRELDPEVLARAGDAVASRFGWVPYDASEWGITDDDYWQALAAEYDRLLAAPAEGDNK